MKTCLMFSNMMLKRVLSHNLEIVLALNSVKNSNVFEQLTGSGYRSVFEKTFALWVLQSSFDNFS